MLLQYQLLPSGLYPAILLLMLLTHTRGVSAGEEGGPAGSAQRRRSHVMVQTRARRTQAGDNNTWCFRMRSWCRAEVVVVVWEGHDVVMREHRSTQPAAHTEAIRACKKRNSLYRPLDNVDLAYLIAPAAQ
jgi:hypothetical protein